jgi:hypothetical protein
VLHAAKANVAITANKSGFFIIVVNCIGFLMAIPVTDVGNKYSAVEEFLNNEIVCARDDPQRQAMPHLPSCRYANALSEGFALDIIYSIPFAIACAAPVLVVHRAFLRGARQADARNLGGAQSGAPEIQLICERLATCIGTTLLQQCPRCSHFVRQEIDGETGTSTIARMTWCDGQEVRAIVCSDRPERPRHGCARTDWTGMVRYRTDADRSVR